MRGTAEMGSGHKLAEASPRAGDSTLLSGNFQWQIAKLTFGTSEGIECASRPVEARWLKPLFANHAAQEEEFAVRIPQHQLSLPIRDTRVDANFSPIQGTDSHSVIVH